MLRLYEELAKTPAGRERAARIYTRARARIYTRARPTYHPIAVGTIDAILKQR